MNNSNTNQTNIFRATSYNSITAAIGATPLVRLPRISVRDSHRLPGILFGKLEAFNPAGSVKCRIGAAMLETARREGKLKKGGEKSKESLCASSRKFYAHAI